MAGKQALKLPPIRDAQTQIMPDHALGYRMATAGRRSFSHHPHKCLVCAHRLYISSATSPVSFPCGESFV